MSDVLVVGQHELVWKQRIASDAVAGRERRTFLLETAVEAAIRRMGDARVAPLAAAVTASGASIVQLKRASQQQVESAFDVWHFHDKPILC